MINRYNTTQPAATNPTKQARWTCREKKGEQDISKSWTDDEIEILMNLWVQCESLSNHKSQEYHNKGATFKKFSVYPK